MQKFFEGFEKSASTRFMREALKKAKGGKDLRPKDVAHKGKGKHSVRMPGENPARSYFAKRTMFRKMTSPEKLPNKSVREMYSKRTPAQKRKTLEYVLKMD
jgi:hypothetical protein